MDKKENDVISDELQETTSIEFKDAIRQIIACFIAFTLVIPAGVNYSYSAILLPQLSGNESVITITESEQSWIASLLPISMPIGATMVGLLMDKFGRKKILLATGFTFIGAWILQGCAISVWHIYAARIICGFSGGLTTVSLIYVSEIAHPAYRSMLLSLNSVFVSLGILITCVLGTWFEWRSLAFIYCIMVIISNVLIWFLPESPYWLITFKNDTHGTATSLRWLYKNNQQIFENQYQQILNSSIIKPTIEENATKTERSKLLSLKKELNLYKEPIIYKPIIILLTIFVFQQFSGAYVIIFYAVQLFREVSGEVNNGFSEYVALVLLGVIRFIMAVISALISKKIGRRPLLMISALGMALCSFITACYMYWRLSQKETNGYDNFPLIFLLLYVTFGSLGYLIIPWTLIGELLPVKVRGTLGSCILASANVLMFIVVKMFPYLLDTFKMPCLFMAVTIINIGSVGYVYFYLPETLGKSFKEIEFFFNKNT